MNFDYGYVLNRAFQITWKHKSFWLFSIIPMLIIFLVFGALAAPVILIGDNENLIGLVLVLWIGVFILGMIFTFVIGVAGSVSLILGILRAERGEGSTSFMDLVRDGIPYFGRALGVMLIVQSSIGLVFTLFFLCVALASAVTMGLAALCFQPIMILITPVSFLVVAVMVGAIIAVIDEDLGAWDAVKRALGVTREHVWKFILLTVVVYFGISMVSGFFIVPAMLPAMFAPLALEMDGGQPIFILSILAFICLFVPLMSLLSGISGVFMNATVGVAYLRLAPGSETPANALETQKEN